MERQRINREKDQDLVTGEIKRHSDKLIRYLEEHAIPLAVARYKSHVNICDIDGNIRWSTGLFSRTHLTVTVFIKVQDYDFVTSFSTYDLAEQVINSVKVTFEKISGVILEHRRNLLEKRHRQHRIEISLPIAAIN